MATRTTVTSRKNDGDIVVVTWEGFTTAADVGSPVQLLEHTDVSVQLVGTVGSSPNVFIEGSNDLSSWCTLKDVHGTALSSLSTITALHQVAEKPLYIRPRLSATSGGTDLDVVMVMRRPAQ